MLLFAVIKLVHVVLLLVFGSVAFAFWTLLSFISQRSRLSEERLQRFGKAGGQSLVTSTTVSAKNVERLQGMLDAAKSMSAPLMPQNEQEQSKLKLKLCHAGFRSESASAVYLGLRFACLMFFGLVGCVLAYSKYGMTLKAGQWAVLFVALGFYLPNIVLWWLVRKRQQEIFLSMPDALDLLVVCVESGLGLDAAMRKVCDEMKDHAKVICEEFALANFQLQMGRSRRDVLHDLGVRTGVDDMRSLAAILIQADRFGSSIAQALRVQSDSMRTRRRQLAEEKAAKTAVQLIFPLVLFIFPGIFVVLVGPAAIKISETLFTQQ